MSLEITQFNNLKPEDIFSFLDIKENTRRDYMHRIKDFIKFIEAEGTNFNTYLAYKRYLELRNDWSISSKNKYLITAKIFLKEANRQGLIKTDITQNIKGFKQTKKHKKDGINETQINKIAQHLRSLQETPRNIRLKAILSLLIYQGLRQVEVIRLDVKDLNFLDNTALIQGKGRDDKEIINLHPETALTLKKYLKLNKISDGALFISNSNNQSKKQRLTTRTIRGIIKDTLNKLGIENTTHGFRHYFTTNLIKRYKGNLLEIAQYTRHRSLEMLQVYNDNIKRKNDLPKYYEAFNYIKL